jgi:hypothetical protein
MNQTTEKTIMWQIRGVKKEVRKKIKHFAFEKEISIADALELLADKIPKS